MSAPDDRHGYIHGTALVVGERGLLIRGSSGSGKSRLAVLLLAEARRRGLFARLVGDDRVALMRWGDRLVARGHPIIAGLIERRTAGIATVPAEPGCVLGLVVDLSEEPLPRLPCAESTHVELAGIPIACVRLAAGLHGIDSAEVLDRLLSASRIVP